MNIALARLIKDLHTSKELEVNEKKIAEYIISNIDNLPDDFEECVNLLLSRFGNSFSPEYSKVEIYIFMLLILKRFEEGVYDE